MIEVIPHNRPVTTAMVGSRINGKENVVTFDPPITVRKGDNVQLNGDKVFLNGKFFGNITRKGGHGKK